MGDVPEQVFIDAARADAERYCAVSGAVGIDVEETARLMARDPALRTIAASAYRAGQAAKQVDVWFDGYQAGHLDERAGLNRDAATPDGPRRWALPPADVIARRFHETYERLAPDFGYRTREASAKPWAEVPEQNRALMIRTVMEVRDWLTDATPAADGQEGTGT